MNKTYIWYKCTCLYTKEVPKICKNCIFQNPVKLAGGKILYFIVSLTYSYSREGHSTIILEAANQMPCTPDVVIASVGGGGMLNGILQGMWKVGWKDVPVIAMETVGADCYNAAVKAGKLVTLPAITR